MILEDPVSGFRYPEPWIASCQEPDRLDDIRKGLFILTSSGAVLRRGFSTGTTAAAACKAAILSLEHPVSRVDVLLPSRIRAYLPVEGREGTGICIKDAGDHPSDVTNGLRFVAVATSNLESITFIPMKGIGRFERVTPRYKKGEPAISPPALETIHTAILEGMQTIALSGVTVRLSIPEGERIALKTLNPQIGVMGGISILGTTGFVEPWDVHLTESVLERVRNTRRVVLTTGRVGLRFSRLLFPSHEVILVGGKIQEALEIAQGDVILCGLPGLILRALDPDILKGTPHATVEEMSQDPACANKIRDTLARFQDQFPHKRVVLINRAGQIIGSAG